MPASTDLENTLEVLSRILLWCFVLGFVFLLLWFALYIVAGDFAFGIHGEIFDLTRNDFDLMNYLGMAFLKIAVFTLFLIPYMAVRLVLKGVKCPDAKS